jgi:hypothetical protein
MSVDLRNCKKGDILISTQGKKLRYLRPTKGIEYGDHVVEYLDKNLGKGTRTHDGFVFKNNRFNKTDNDIVEIIKQ